jgi:hypothetical protein
MAVILVGEVWAVRCAIATSTVNKIVTKDGCVACAKLKFSATKQINECYNDFSLRNGLKLMQTYHPTGFTLSEFELEILKKELMKTGKTRSEIVRGLIADLGKKQAKQNKAA